MILVIFKACNLVREDRGLFDCLRASGFRILGLEVSSLSALGVGWSGLLGQRMSGFEAWGFGFKAEG